MTAAQAVQPFLDAAPRTLRDRRDRQATCRAASAHRCSHGEALVHRPRAAASCWRAARRRGPRRHRPATCAPAATSPATAHRTRDASASASGRPAALRIPSSAEPRDDVSLPGRQTGQIHQHSARQERRQRAAGVEPLGDAVRAPAADPLTISTAPSCVEEEAGRCRTVVRQGHEDAAVVDHTVAREVLAARWQRRMAEGRLEIAAPPRDETRSPRRSIGKHAGDVGRLARARRRSQRTGARRRPSGNRRPRRRAACDRSIGIGHPDEQHAPSSRQA